MNKAVLLGCALTGMIVSGPANARLLDPAKPDDAIEIMKRAQCGVRDGVPAIYHWSGRVYSRVQGEPDRLLFSGEGMNVRQCTTITDPKRGTGYRLVSREIMLFTDPKTGEIIRQWTNPWTNETVEVMHIANDPVNFPAAYPRSADGKPFTPGFKRMGPWLAMPSEIPLYYHNVLAGDYQDYIGGKYHAMEIFDFMAPAEEILDTRNATSYPSISWVRISDWMPWMKMRGRPGQLVFNAVGTKLDRFDALPTLVKDEIALNYPAYNQPPPVNDTRPNETTWTVFKKWVAERQKTAPPAQKGSH